MRWWRRSRLARAVVMILLLWTAADLLDTSLCALDNEMTGSAPTASGSLVRYEPPDSEPFQPSQHVDDCFCCSHCVALQSLLPPTFTAQIVFRYSPLDVSAPRTSGARLYHPPLA
jgi:hypothetical protein